MCLECKALRMTDWATSLVDAEQNIQSYKTIGKVLISRSLFPGVQSDEVWPSDHGSAHAQGYCIRLFGSSVLWPFVLV